MQEPQIQTQSVEPQKYPGTNLTMAEITKMIDYINRVSIKIKTKHTQLSTDFMKSKMGIETQYLANLLTSYFKNEPRFQEESGILKLENNDFLGFIHHIETVVSHLKSLDPKFSEKITKMSTNYKKDVNLSFDDFNYFLDVLNTTVKESRKIKELAQRDPTIEELHKLINFFDAFSQTINNKYPSLKRDTKHFAEIHLARLKNYFIELNAWKQLLIYLLFDEEIAKIQSKDSSDKNDQVAQGFNIIIKQKLFSDNDLEKFIKLKQENKVTPDNLTQKLSDLSDKLAKRFSDINKDQDPHSYAKIMKDIIHQVINGKYDRVHLIFGTIVKIIATLSRPKTLATTEFESVKALHTLILKKLGKMLSQVKSERQKFLSEIKMRKQELLDKHAKELSKINKFHEELTKNQERLFAAPKGEEMLQAKRRIIVTKLHEIHAARLKIDTALHENAAAKARFRQTHPPTDWAANTKLHDEYSAKLIPNLKWSRASKTQVSAFNKQLAEIDSRREVLQNVFASEVQRVFARAKVANNSLPKEERMPN